MPQNRFESILETVGRTPVVRIAKLAPPHVRLYVKLESFNPMGSVKDRLALGVIEDAERRGALRPGQTVIEATSGNTGIGLAMVCARKGYPLVVIMSENFSVERRKLMRFLGAKVVLTPAALKGSGHARQGHRARRRARLVPVPSVRERGQRGHPLAHDRTGDPGGLRRRAARLLRDRLRHRRHAQGSGARAARAESAHPHRRVRAGQLAGARQRHPPAARRGRGAGRQPSELPPAPDAGLEPGLHTQAHPGRRGARIHRPHRAGQRRPRARAVPGARAPGGHAGRNLRRRDARRRPHGVRGGAAGQHRAVHAAGYRRALPEHAAVRRDPCRHGRRRARDLALDSQLPLRCGEPAGAGARCRGGGTRRICPRPRRS